MPTTYSFLLLDMFHYQDPGQEFQVDGFPTKGLAIEFARGRVRIRSGRGVEIPRSTRLSSPKSAQNDDA